MFKRSADQILPVQNPAPRKKMERSSGENEVLLNQISNLMLGMEERIKEELLKAQNIAITSVRDDIQASLNNLQSELSVELKDLHKGLSIASDRAEENSRQIQDLTVRVQVLEEENKVLKWKQTDTENRDKRTNLVLQGVSESVSDAALEQHFLQVYRDHLKIQEDIKIERIHRVGVQGRQCSRNVVIKFNSFRDRQQIWEKQRLLKTMGLYLDEHFALPVQQERAQLLPFLQAARKRGEKATMIINKLLIAGQRYSANSTDLRSLQLRYGTNIKDHSEKEINTDAGPAIAFYGRFSELSNFYLTPVKVRDRTFPTVEHYYTTRKAELNA